MAPQCRQRSYIGAWWPGAAYLGMMIQHPIKPWASIMTAVGPYLVHRLGTTRSPNLDTISVNYAILTNAVGDVASPRYCQSGSGWPNVLDLSRPGEI